MDFGSDNATFQLNHLLQYSSKNGPNVMKALDFVYEDTKEKILQARKTCVALILPPWKVRAGFVSATDSCFVLNFLTDFLSIKCNTFLHK